MNLMVFNIDPRKGTQVARVSSQDDEYREADDNSEGENDAEDELFLGECENVDGWLCGEWSVLGEWSGVCVCVRGIECVGVGRGVCV